SGTPRVVKAPRIELRTSRTCVASTGVTPAVIVGSVQEAGGKAANVLIRLAAVLTSDKCTPRIGVVPAAIGSSVNGTVAATSGTLNEDVPPAPPARTR